MEGIIQEGKDLIEHDIGPEALDEVRSLLGRKACLLPRMGDTCTSGSDQTAITPNEESATKQAAQRFGSSMHAPGWAASLPVGREQDGRGRDGSCGRTPQGRVQEAHGTFHVQFASVVRRGHHRRTHCPLRVLALSTLLGNSDDDGVDLYSGGELVGYSRGDITPRTVRELLRATTTKQSTVNVLVAPSRW